MVKFEFILNDVDASNLINILQDEQTRALDKGNEYMAAVRQRAGNHQVAQANANWYYGHAKYLEELKQKVLAGNTRVG